MVTPSSSTCYYPASGENPWSRILSSDPSRRWRRELNGRDVRLFSQSKGRFFDSSDPREAAKIMHSKYHSTEPRHKCKREVDDLGIPLIAGVKQSLVLHSDSPGSRASSVAGGPRVQNGNGKHTENGKNKQNSTDRSPMNANSPIAKKGILKSSMKHMSQTHHGGFLNGNSPTTAGGTPDSSPKSNSSPNNINSPSSKPPTTAHSAASRTTHHSNGSSHRSSDSTAHSEDKSGDKLSAERLAASVVRAEPTLKERVPKLERHVKESELKGNIMNPVFENGHYRREKKGDLCLYQIDKKDVEWNTDNDHRWSRPRLTGFWVYGTESRVDHQIGMSQHANTITKHLANQFTIPEYRKYEHYTMVNQMGAAERRRAKSNDVKTKKDQIYSFVGDNYLCNRNGAIQKFRKENNLDNSPENVPEMRTSAHDPNLSEVYYRQINGMRDNDLEPRPLHGRWLNDWSPPGKIEATHQTRRNIEEPRKAKAQKEERLAQLKQDRLSRTRWIGDDKFHSSVFYKDAYDSNCTVPNRPNGTPSNFKVIDHLLPVSPSATASSKTVKLEWARLDREAGLIAERSSG